MLELVEIQDLRVSFGELLVLDNVSLTVTKGELVAIIGPSGCGKSTLLRIIAGIIPGMIKARVEGGVLVLGYKPEKVPPGGIEVIFQEENLFPWRDAKGNVRLGAELLQSENSLPQAEELLQLVGLSGFENSKPKQLSGGMRQRVALASSLMTSPELLLMDEPLGALDALTREKMWTLLIEVFLSRSEMSSVLVTHHIEEAVVLADRVLVMSKIPSKVVADFSVRVESPRIRDGALSPECFDVANEVRKQIRRLNDD